MEEMQFPDTTAPIWRGACPFCERMHAGFSRVGMYANRTPKRVIGPFPITLNAARVQSGLTVEGLAELAQVSHNTVKRIIFGQASRDRVKVQIAEALGLQVAHILWPEVG